MGNGVLVYDLTMAGVKKPTLNVGGNEKFITNELKTGG